MCKNSRFFFSSFLQIEKSEIKAELNGAIVTFLDDDFAEVGLDSDLCVSPKEVEKLLKRSQAQSALLSELDRETARSKEFLTKVRCYRLKL